MADVFADHETAERHFERAVAVDRALSAPLLAQTLVSYGTMLRRRGPAAHERCTTMLAEAVQIAERYGMHGLRLTAIRLLHTNGR